MGESIQTAKERLRRELRALRLHREHQGLTAPIHGAACRALVCSGVFEAADAVVLYAPQTGEIDPRPIYEAASARGVDTYYPRVDADRMTFRRAAPTDLTPGRFGIPEPDGDAALLAVDRTGVVFVVPGLAFDRHGSRLGSGRGCFDRAFVSFPQGVRVGLTTEEFLLDRLPADRWDVRMHAIATERGLFAVDDGQATMGEHR